MSIHAADMDHLHHARNAAAHYLRTRGYIEEATLIERGQGDDFAEVRIALQLHQQMHDTLNRYRRVLQYYADPDFWDDQHSGYASAQDDKGSLAQNALSGDADKAQLYFE